MSGKIMVGLRFTGGNIMENKRNWLALAAFICSLVPIVPAAFFAWIYLSPSTWEGQLVASAGQLGGPGQY
jgi:hypothetical protein